MKQLLQQFDSRDTRVARVSAPAAGTVCLLAESRPGVASAGTERVAGFRPGGAPPEGAQPAGPGAADPGLARRGLCGPGRE